MYTKVQAVKDAVVIEMSLAIVFSLGAIVAPTKITAAVWLICAGFIMVAAVGYYSVGEKWLAVEQRAATSHLVHGHE